MAIGNLTVQTTTGDETIPVSGATIRIRGTDGTLLFESVTNESGNTRTFALAAPRVDYGLSPETAEKAFAFYNVEAFKDGYQSVVVTNMPNIAGDSFLPIHMHPLATAAARTQIAPATQNVEVINIGLPAAALPTAPQLQAEVPAPFAAVNNSDLRAEYISPQSQIVAGQYGRAIPNAVSQPNERLSNGVVFIPDYIRVHLGLPSTTSAQTVSVPFVDYIKNVTSSEIISTWPRNSIIANIHVIVTFALNRIYTEWYPSRGYNFDISSETSHDQKYIHGRNIYASIATEVDIYFSTYARRIGYANPFFTQFCNGTTTKCEGLSQWGTVDLANRGYTPIQILHNYYPKDLELVKSDIVQGIQASYPGTALSIGSTGTSVRRIQNFLNRIRVNYPAIPQITNPNGTYGSDTANAVRVFQNTFHVGLTDGVVGPTTWNKITTVYVAITKLGELNSEGERVGLSPNPPTVTIRQGSRGADVLHLQYIINVLSNYFDYIPTVIKDSYFGPSTTNAVIAFQRANGLTADGIVGPATWTKLYSVYRSLDEGPTPPPPPPPFPPFPGTPLRIGSTGENVRVIQNALNEIRKVYTNIPLLTVDGSFGPATHAAVVAFQQQFGLTPDGIVGPLTWDEIMKQYLIVTGGGGTTPPPTLPPFPGTLRLGSTGEDVRVLQTNLNKARTLFTNSPPITVDGVFGPATQTAVIGFQRNNNLAPDGIVGPLTWNLIMQQAASIT